MNISIELIPRSEGHLSAELATIREHYRSVNTINIPDLTRMEMRSWEGCALARTYFDKAIPHLRACDTHPDRPLPMIDTLVERDITEVLVVTGDLDHDNPPAARAIDLIRRLRVELPHLKIYAALDPYRENLQTEQDYFEAKIEAGANGFFTQPFFDLRLMGIYADMLQGIEVFWGVAPVVSKPSVRYWRTRNRAVFPREFEPTLEWNRQFACRALDFVRERDGNVYFMPIRVDLAEYLFGML
jgi:methylenetetrahydrofolate reductase (NADPH)